MQNKRNSHCGQQMLDQLEFTCDQHPDLRDCPDALIAYLSKFNEYGIRIHNGGSSWAVISYCPWCCIQLPASRRDEWFNRLEALGFSEPSEQPIPEEFHSDRWYRHDA
jgi:hypothetical protein